MADADLAARSLARSSREKTETSPANTVAGLALALLAALLAAPSQTHAQQPTMTVVTLLPSGKALVGSTPIPTKDIAAHLAAQSGAPRAGLRMVTIQSCEKVPADAIQDLRQDLQKRNFMVVIDLGQPDARLCAR